MPPGLERAAEFLRQLKSIDSGRVPVEVKRALYEYIPAMEQSFEALKDRQDPSPFEAICTQKTAELNDAIQRNL